DGLDHCSIDYRSARWNDRGGKRSRVRCAYDCSTSGGPRANANDRGCMSNPIDVAEKEVCLVDDDPSVLKSMHYLLASEGIKVRMINTAEDFLAHDSNHRVRVVVTDIWMDQVTGLEVLARLCAISPKTRVIVITAREDPAARGTAMAIGPVAFFMKPFDDEKFITAVRDALSQSRK